MNIYKYWQFIGHEFDILLKLKAIFNQVVRNEHTHEGYSQKG